MAKADMQARERVLYVEVAPSGIPLTPLDVDEDEAKVWISGMAQLFSTLANTWRLGIDQALTDAKKRV